MRLIALVIAYGLGKGRTPRTVGRGEAEGDREIQGHFREDRLAQNPVQGKLISICSSTQSEE